MTQEPHWLQWAREIQAIAQTGLHFSESPYDRERYQKLQELAVEIFAQHSNLDPGPIRALFNQETGYATPKVDVRGLVFRDDTVLLVRERSDGRWTLPGGWADVNDSPSEAVEREVREESGFEAKASRLLAVYDRAKHAHYPLCAYHVYKLFILCELTGGEAAASMETSEVGFFGERQLPPLSEERVLPEQIAYCFRQRLDPRAQPHFD